MIRFLIFLFSISIASDIRADDAKPDVVFGEIQIFDSATISSDLEARTRTFEGEKVRVEFDNTVLTCEKIVIQLDDAQKLESFVATSAMVKVERKGLKGKLQSTKSRGAEWSAETEEIILSGGPPVLQDGNSMVEPSVANAKIILLKGGEHRIKTWTCRCPKFRVGPLPEGKKPRIEIKIPVIEKQKKREVTNQ